jgi:RHS repeat-associated protein
MNMSGVTFTYDAYGRRIAKTASSTTTNYLYDGANIVQELVSGTPTANLLSGGIDEVFTRTDSTWTANFLADGLGSTLALANSSGSVQTEYTYDPFGNTSISGSATTPYEYTGRENDGTGLYFYRARYLSPTLQRFASEDPIGLAGGTNFYAYVENDPTNFRDPLGLAPDGRKCSTTDCDKYADLNRYDLYFICHLFPFTPKFNCVRTCLQQNFTAGPSQIGTYQNELIGSVPSTHLATDGLASLTNGIVNAYGPRTHLVCFQQCF